MHPLVVKLKSGEYDGKDIMQAWCLIGQLEQENAELAADNEAMYLALEELAVLGMVIDQVIH